MRPGGIEMAEIGTGSLYQRFIGPLLSRDEGADAEQLSQINPDIWDDAAFASTVYWYHTPYGYAAGPTGASTGDFFHDAFDNTFASAQAAIDAATAKDLASDTFSGGGGGPQVTTRVPFMLGWKVQV